MIKYDRDKQTRKLCIQCGEPYKLKRSDHEFRNKIGLKRTCKNEDCEVKSKKKYRMGLHKKAMQNVRKQRAQKKREETQERKAERARIRQMKIDAGIITAEKHWNEPLQKAVNEIVRYIDHFESCFMLPGYRGEKQAGHVIGVGSNQTLRYLFANIYGEAKKSNGNQNIGNSDRKRGLARAKGEQAVEYLEQCVLLNPSIHLDHREIKEKAALARKILKKMKANDIIYTRRQLDEMLGIYKLPDLSKYESQNG